MDHMCSCTVSVSSLPFPRLGLLACSRRRRLALQQALGLAQVRVQQLAPAPVEQVEREREARTVHTCDGYIGVCV